MSALSDLQDSLRDIRTRKAAAERAVQDSRARVAALNAKQGQVTRGRGGPGTRLDDVKQQLTAAQAEVTRLAAARDTLVAAENAAINKLVTLGTPQTVIETLDDSYPFLLFPLRLETRFINRGTTRQLWLRIYPDDCQVQTYTDFITDSELRDVRRFWIDYWKAGGIDDQRRAAWRGLAMSHGSGRAAVLVGRYAPAGAAPAKAHPQDVLLVVAPGTTLTPAERAAAEKYWIAFWRAGKDAHARDLARQALVTAVGAAPAGRIQTSWAPGNIDDEPLAPHTRQAVAVSVVTIDMPPPEGITTSPTAWQQAPRVTTLPEFFVATGILNGQTVFTKQGARIPSSLPVGPDPSLPDAQQIKTDQGEIQLNQELRWLTDFDAAIQSGMGMKIDLTPQQYTAGFDRLFVLGVRLSSDAEHGAQLLEALLSDHQASKSGFGLLRQGTPTNNTDDDRSGYSWLEDPDESYDRVFGTAKDFPLSNDLLAKRDGQWLAELLGIDVAAVRPAANAGGLDQAHARAMNTALWPTTWGYFFDTMIEQLDDATIERIRTFFIRYISGRGAVPGIRIGKQPYGILPATVRSRLYLDPNTIPSSVPIPVHPVVVPGPKTPGDTPAPGPGPHPVLSPGPVLVAVSPWTLDFLNALQSRLDTLYGEFKKMTKDCPHIGRTGDPQQTLLDIIGQNPASVEYYQRFVLTFEQLINQILLEEGANAAVLAAQVLSTARAVRDPAALAALGIDANRTSMLDKWLHDAPNPMTGPVIDDVPLSETDPIRAYAGDGKNYLAWLASAGFEAIRREDFGGKPKPKALLYLVAHYAVLMSYWDASVRLLAAANLADRNAVRSEPAFLQIGDQADGGSKWQQLLIAEPRVTGEPRTTIGEYLDRSTVIQTAAATRLRDVKAALKTLQDAPTGSLERLFAEHVDLCTYRLDAWRLGLVHHRLAQQRQRKARGVYLGAFGWLEELRPENKVLTPVSAPAGLHPSFTRAGREPIVRDSTNAGYIHAPSINHATAAAVLRNAYRAHATNANPGVMSVNLSSARVRAALAITQGVQHGQGLAELLGYEFERGLHDAHNLTGAEVERFTFALRAKFPLVANKHNLTKVGADIPIDKLEARNVIDGLKLVGYVRKTGKSQYPFGFTTGTGSTDLPVATAAEAAAINAQVVHLQDINDAFADLMLAESVYQVVQGQTDRAAAASDVIGKGARPDEPEVVRTPRSGLSLAHRVVLHCDPGAPAPAIATPRAVAEPAVDSWLTDRLPPAASVACRVQWSDPTHSAQDFVVTQASLGLAATDMLHLIAIDGNQGVSELDDRIEQFVRASVAHHPATVIAIRYTDPVPGKVSLFELSALMRSLRKLILESRALAATDMARAAEAGSGGPRWDTAELRTRVNAAITALNARIAPLQALEANAAATAEDYLDQAAVLFLGAALHGVPETGSGALRGRVRDLYQRAAGKLDAVITRWEEHRSEYDKLLAGLAVLPADDARIAALARAERLVSTTSTEPRPATVAQFQVIVAGKRSSFDAALANLRAPRSAPVTRLNDFFNLLEPVLAAIASFDLMCFDQDRKANDLAPERASLSAIRADTVRRVSGVRASIQQRVASAQGLVTAAQANADPEAAFKLLDQAARQVLGDSAKLLPRFTLAEDSAAELRNAFAGSPTLLTQLVASGRDFPVDDWLYGVARVRSKMAHWENSAALAEAFGRPTAELTPMQLPFQADDRWAALELPSGYTLSGEKLLYTACFAKPFDDARPQCGLVLDEWTEVVPAAEDVTGIAFHFDQPNTEPPQTILLATPPHFRGGWRWSDLMDTLDETLDEARIRAIEPFQVESTGFGQFLPAVLLVVTQSLMTISVNLADNNG